MLPRCLALLLLSLTGLVGTARAAPPLHEETVTGGSTGLVTVTSASPLTAVTDHLYLAAVSSRPHLAVSSVTGLGLAWFPAGSQCAGRDKTGVTIWAATGTPTASGTVTASFASAASVAALAVSRYSGADSIAPIGNVASANTNAVAGGCSGGTDSAAYAFDLTTTVADALVYGASAMRNRTHTPGPGLVERVETVEGSAGTAASLATFDAGLASAQTISVSGTLSGLVDWAAIALEVRPAGTSIPGGLIRVDPSEHAFGSTVPGASRLVAIEVRNDGIAALNVLGSTLSGSDADLFDVESGGAPFTLAPGTSAPLMLRFTPVTGGSAAATLELSSDDPNTPQLDIPLTGLGANADGIWISAAELSEKPMSGPAWDAVLAAADGDLGIPEVGSFGSKHDTLTLAVALLYGRTGNASYRAKARDAIMAAIGTESTTVQAVQPCRNLASYVFAADLIDLASFDPTSDASFRSWIDSIRFVVWPDGSMIEEDEERANNHGRMCGMSRAAIARYLDDQPELERSAQIFAGLLGDTSVYAAFEWRYDLSWQNDEAGPVGINPMGAMKQGFSVDGALPEEMRRGGPFAFPPTPTGYPWEALQGILVEAVILDRAGYDVFEWSDQAILRAVEFLDALDASYPLDGWWANGDDTWSPWLVNAIYGTSFPTAPAAQGKCMAWTDWTHAPIGSAVPALSGWGLALLATLLLLSAPGYRLACQRRGA